MKRYLFCTAIAAMVLTSCSNDDFLGEVPGNNTNAVTAKEISFSGEAGKTSRGTRADGDKTGEAAANALNKKFVVFGTKTTSDGTTTQTVFDHYNVEWPATTGSTGWDYIGKSKNSLNTTAEKQSKKYWDFSAKMYKFVAFSFGTAAQGTAEDQVEASKVTNSDTGYSYTLTGKISELVKCYVANLVEATPTDYATANKNVSFTFRSLGTKINIGLYETIDGYSVKDVKFYKSATDNAPTTTPTLYASSATLPKGTEKEKITVTFNTDKTPKVEWTELSTSNTARQMVTRGENNETSEGTTATTTSKTTFITFGDLNKVTAESKENAGQDYIGRTERNNASKPTTPVAVLPCDAGALTLKVDYTLISIDGSGETINVKGATATIPTENTKWASNKSYTYIFKISDKTNGSTAEGHQGLYPINFDAVVTETEDSNHDDINLGNK